MPGFFELADPAAYADGPHPADYECPCPTPDDQYLLEIDEGSVSIVHKACGKPPGGDWWQETLCLTPVPVTVTAEPYGNCNGSEWHGELRCDCGSVAVVTINGLPAADEPAP